MWSQVNIYNRTRHKLRMRWPLKLVIVLTVIDLFAAVAGIFGVQDGLLLPVLLFAPIFIIGLTCTVETKNEQLLRFGCMALSLFILIPVGIVFVRTVPWNIG